MLDTWLIVVIVVGCVVFVLGMVVLFVVTRHLRRQKGKDTKTAGERSPKVAPASPTSSLPTGSRSVDNPVFGRSSVHFGNTPPAEAAGASEPESQFGFTDDQLEEVVVPEPKRPGDEGAKHDSGAAGAESGVSSAAEPSTGAAQEVNDSKRTSDADQATPVANGTSQQSQEQASESGESREDRKSKLAAMRAARERKRQEEWQELEESLRVIDEIYNSEI